LGIINPDGDIESIMDWQNINKGEFDNIVVSIADDQVSSELAGEAVILNLETGKYYGLNSVGARIWNLLQEEKSLGEIRDTILAEYDVEAEQCEQDILELLQKLSDHDLLKAPNGQST
jgi:hypothetical protein